MSNLLKTELYKLFHCWYFLGIGLFNLLLSSVLLLDSKRETSNLFFASLYNTPLLYFLIIVFASMFVGNDLGGKTLQPYITAGHKRSWVFLAKVIVYQMGCIVILVLPLFIHELISLFYMKEMFVTTDGTFITIVMIVFSIMAMCILPFFLAFIFHDMGRTLAVSMALFFLMIFLMNGDNAQYIMRILPMGQLRLISLQQFHLANADFVVVDFLWNFILCLGANVLFCRTDLK